MAEAAAKVSDLGAHVIAVQDGLAKIRLNDPVAGRLTKNEVAYILAAPDRGEGPRLRLKSEVLRVRGDTADLQVFEDTGGVAIGDQVDLTGAMLSVDLGPGLLGQVYDGLQNPLETLASAHGYFLPRGEDIPALDPTPNWSFVPSVRVGHKVSAGQTVGTVQEGRFTHRIMAPFDAVGEHEVTWVQEGTFPHGVPVARLKPLQGGGAERAVTLSQRWPVRRPLPEVLYRTGRARRLFPETPLVTSLRLIDTFFPIARGGTGCIPGPFGAGKTVLQNLISRYSAVDIVIIVACGERAGEVVETITEFPKLPDPQRPDGGGSLMDRTILICNTSSMPVAAREASIYTGITLGEYYRQMGYEVLLLADSTSRWAQAMRETSGRLEEIPGEEAFPAYLDSAIRAVYERAGVVETPDGVTGSLTMIGTVSPAGGNFEEPVTQSTLGVVKTFLGLSADRAYKRFYPAVDPLLSWSRYGAQLAPWFDKEMGEDWTEAVQAMIALLRRGDDVDQMTQVTGEEGITLEDFVTLQKARLVDMVYLQQDAFDPVDVSAPLPRQRETFALLRAAVDMERAFADKDDARRFFTRLVETFRNLNYAAEGTPERGRLTGEIRRMLEGA